MKVLSLFDGISCARVALERTGIPVEAYYASEIDKYAIQISQKNYPDIIQVGDVKDLNGSKFHGISLPRIDLLIGGSPCQDLSIAKKDRKGLSGDRSGLFWEYVRILKEVKPKYFILENVNSMPKEARALISETLGVEPIMIDAALVSAQRRKRLFWTNIPNVTLPEDRGILLKDILEDGVVDRDKSHCIDANYHKGASLEQYLTKGRRQLVMKEKSNIIRTGGRGSDAGDKHDWESVYQYRRTYWRETKGGKVPTLTANMGTGGNNVPYVSNVPITVAVIPEALRPKGNYLPRERVLHPNGKFRAVSTVSNQQPWITEPVALRNRGEGKKPEYNGTGKANALTTVQTDSMVDIPPIRKLTPMECERLQSLPDNYTEGVSNTQRYKALGNAFNVEVIAHILRSILPPPQPVETVI